MPSKEKETTLQEEVKQTNDKISKLAKEVGLDDMPLNCLADYVRYNEKARSINKKFRVHRYPVKPCPIDLHPKQRVIVTYGNGDTHKIPVYLSNEMIDFKDKLTPGKPYDLPVMIVDYIAELGSPVWEKRENPDGSIDTYEGAKTPRFAVRTVYQN